MALAIAFTVYLTFCAFLFFGTMGAPAIFGRLAIGLCFSEFVASVAWSVNPSRILESVAGLQIPVLAGTTLVLAAGYGLHIARRW